MNIQYMVTCPDCENTGDRKNICISACPNNAISYQPWFGNIVGGYSPITDDDKCVDCGECFKACDEVARRIGGWIMPKTERIQ